MIVSLDWLSDYVDLPPVANLTERLLLSGLNHEATEAVGADTAVDLEVTSNRPDCLGHIGIAREVAAVFDRPLRIPAVDLPATGTQPAVAVAIAAGDICPFYSARVIRGTAIGPSPDWLVRRLATVGVASVNNVVDVTNYVMLESGQPLHAFDLGQLAGGQMVIRRAQPGEPFVAINHKRYELSDEMCVIADAERPVALAGVMGGADTEITADTTDILLESAQFAPLPVRTAARRLVLGSPSSYRFERGPDPAAVDWASRRAAALILELAGGELDGPAAEAGRLACSPATIRLRPGRVAEVLGVDVPANRQRAILRPLGFVEQSDSAATMVWQAPSWRRDCSREIDLVEEIARIEGYEKVPENAAITARPIARSPRERLVRMAGEVCVAAGFCEAMTRSVVAESLESAGSPWSDAEPLVCRPPLIRGADRLRRTLLPSLLEARSTSLASGAAHGDLFEIARAYLRRSGPAGPADSPAEEPLLLAAVTDGDFFQAKGLAAAVLVRLGLSESAPAAAPAATAATLAVGYRPLSSGLLVAGRAAEIVLCRGNATERRIGIVGEIAHRLLGEAGLEQPVAAIELRLDGLEFLTDWEPPRPPLSSQPAVDRDLNIVVDETVPWAAIVAAIESTGCDALESVKLVEIWRDRDRLGPGKKSVVVSLRLRSRAATLMAEEANSLVAAMVAACTHQTGGVLRG